MTNMSAVHRTAPGQPGGRLATVAGAIEARMPGRWQFAAALVGAILFATIFYFRTLSGWDVGSDLRMIYDRAGDALREGGQVYWRDPVWNNYYYAPPLAVLFATVSWLPLPVLHALIVVADLVCARIITGAWWSAFALGAWPIVPLEVGGGNINLMIGAAIVLSVRGGPVWPLALGSFAKLAPVLALHPRDWRRFAVAVVVLLATTLPWAGLWIEWVRLLVDAYGREIGPMFPIPFPVRLVVALGLLALWRPWSRAAAAIIAIPAFYWGTMVYAPIPFIVWWRGRRSAQASTARDVPRTVEPAIG
jgi:hypothetical protein